MVPGICLQRHPPHFDPGERRRSDSGCGGVPRIFWAIRSTQAVQTYVCLTGNLHENQGHPYDARDGKAFAGQLDVFGRFNAAHRKGD